MHKRGEISILHPGFRFRGRGGTQHWPNNIRGHIIQREGACDGQIFFINKPSESFIFLYQLHMRSYTYDCVPRILVGDGDSILCTTQFVGSDSVSLGLSRGRHGRLPPLLMAASYNDARNQNN